MDVDGRDWGVRLRRIPARSAEPREYIDGANLAFGHWGDEATFTWVFRDDAELIFVDDDAGRSIAGAGITFRTLRSGQRAAIMTGAWTLPEARGQGAFKQMALAVVAAAAERNGFLVAFVRAENASRRSLVSLGAAMTPSFYCRSIAAPPAVELDAVDPDSAMFPSSFLYAPAQWHRQFLERPGAHIECVGRPGSWAAIVERADGFDRVHAVSDDTALPLLAARAAAAGRRLFWYTNRRPAIACEWTDGFVATLPHTVIDWELQNGDRM